MSDFTEEQKRYLEGFAAGAGLNVSLTSTPATFAGTMGLAPAQLPGGANGAANGAKSLPVLETAAGPDALCHKAQDRQIAEGKKLCNEELAKRKKFPLDQWNDVVQHSA